MHMVFGAIDKVAALLFGSEPLTWLTIGRDTWAEQLYEIDGRTYIIDIHPPKGGQGSDARVRQGTLTTGRTDTDVTLTEVTNPVAKHQVVIAYAAEKPKALIAFGEDKHREPDSFLVILGLAKDDTPEGLATAVPHVAVFEVTPA